MKTLIKSSVIALTAITPLFATIGCEDTVSQKTTTEQKSDGTVVKESEKTTVDRNDGSMTKTTEKEVDKSNKTPNP